MQQVQSNQPTQYRNYSRNMLIALDCLGVICLLLFFVFIFMSSAPSQVGFVLLFGEIFFVMIQDWRGAITLRGASKGYTFHKGQKISTTGGFVLLYIFFPYIMLPIYLVRTSLDYRRMKQLEVQQQKHKIAFLEAELGIMPSTDGTCRACQKPLIAGAEFCQYCGATVIERPKICPSCAATASPDAKWCPKCRTALA